MHALTKEKITPDNEVISDDDKMVIKIEPKDEKITPNNEAIGDDGKMDIKIESNIFNKGSVDNVVIEEKLSEKLCFYKSDYLQPLRKIIINKMTHDVKRSSSNGNCLFSAIKV